MHQASRKLVVACWDVAHNAMLRGWMFADLARSGGWDVTIVGPSATGSVWAPHARTDVPLDLLPGTDIRVFARAAIAYVDAHPASHVLVSKPRFTSMLLGLLYKARWGARVVLDFDDDELAVARAGAPLRPAALRTMTVPVEPWHAAWAQLGMGMLGLADAVTTVGIELQRRHGGTIVRHVRDERAFDPSRIDRTTARERFSVPRDAYVVLFLGTPRRHKGLGHLLDFVHACGRDDVMLCITDMFSDFAHRKEVVARANGRLLFVPPVPFSLAPTLVATADLVALPVDASSPVGRAQVPAKLSDAVAMDVPVLMSPTPAVDDLAAMGLFLNDGPLDLAAFKRAVGLTQAERETHAQKARRIFEREFSYSAARPKLEAVLNGSESRELPAWSGFVQRFAQRLAERA